MLGELALALTLTAGAPSVAKAQELANANNWEELYLAFASAPVKGYSAGDKKKLSGLLAKGCNALELPDPAMAIGLGEKAVELEPTADALLCVGKVGPKVEQNSAAEEALKKGLAKFPKDGRFGLQLGKQLLGENDVQGALAALEKVPKKSDEASEAESLKKKARALQGDGPATRAAAERAAIEPVDTLGGSSGKGGKSGGKTVIVAPTEGEGEAGGSRAPGPNGLGSSYESSVDGEGRRIRANQHFRFRYFNGKRDFGQRADYEGRVQQALELSREASRRVLGESRESPTDVILYSKEEFVMHHGSAMARAVAGFYSENAIRMNDSAEINPQTQAVLVHEYTHAVIDEAASFHTHPNVPIWVNEGLASWVEWRYQGQDGPPVGYTTALKGLAKQGGLPKLKDLENQALINTGNPALAYAFSGCTVRFLVKRKSEGEVMSMIRSIGKGMPWPAALQKHFDVTPERLQEQMESELR
jgi:hypothetical protein